MRRAPSERMLGDLADFQCGQCQCGEGCETLDAPTFFSGLIDDVRIYNVALTAEEIAALAR